MFDIFSMKKLILFTIISLILSLPVYSENAAEFYEKGEQNFQQYNWDIIEAA